MKLCTRLKRSKIDKITALTMTDSYNYTDVICPKFLPHQNSRCLQSKIKYLHQTHNKAKQTQVLNCSVALLSVSHCCYNSIVEEVLPIVTINSITGRQLLINNYGFPLFYPFKHTYCKPNAHMTSLKLRLHVFLFKKQQILFHCFPYVCEE